jgi:hypothetical protein
MSQQTRFRVEAWSCLGSVLGGARLSGMSANILVGVRRTGDLVVPRSILRALTADQDGCPTLE